MNKISGFIITLFITSTVLAQKSPVSEHAAIDKKALLLPDSLTKTTDGLAKYITENFHADKEKARAIFVWVASNIQYDVENMYAINFYEKEAAKISKSLITRKGICSNYAALFNELASKSGLRSFVVEGYTKQNGMADYIPHAWCAAKVDSSWFLFDPTWGSGYVSEGKFYKKLNNDYYKVTPAKLIKSHMPFDYLWQFLNYPVTNQEFYEGKIIQNKAKPFFNFLDSLQLREKQNKIEKLISSAYRIEKNGVKNAMIYDRLKHVKLEIEQDRQTTVMNLYNTAVLNYNEGIKKYNDFIEYRNKQFNPKKEDEEIQDMIDAAEIELNLANGKLEQIEDPDENLSPLIRQLSTSIEDAFGMVKKQKIWVRMYMSQGKVGRKAMFYEKRGGGF